MVPRVDLHTHSFASDALGHPGDIARVFKDIGLKAFALTDHDSLLGQAEAQQAAREVGIEYVPAVEVSARLDDGELGPPGTVHILGYYYQTPPDLPGLMQSDNRFMERIRKALTAAAGSDPSDMFSEFTGFLREQYGAGPTSRMPGIQRQALGGFLAAQGRLDLEQAARAGVALDEWRRQQVVEFLDRYAPPSPKDGLPGVARACRALRDAGAVVILAHPGQGRRVPGASERRRIHAWLDRYVDGVEVYHHRNSQAYRAMLLEITQQRQRPFTGGSDCHNFLHPDRLRRAAVSDAAIETWNAGPAKIYGHISEATPDCLRSLQIARDKRRG